MQLLNNESQFLYRKECINHSWPVSISISLLQARVRQWLMNEPAQLSQVSQAGRRGRQEAVKGAGCHEEQAGRQEEQVR